MSNIKETHIAILNCLCKGKVIDMDKLRQLTFINGIPDAIPGLRTIIWRLMFETLPPDTTEWEEVLKQ